VAFLLVLAVALSALAGCSKPEDKLGEHLMSLADIMNDNRDAPEEGVAELRFYLRAHLPEMLELAATLVVELDEIDDNDARAERAKEIAATLKRPIMRVGKAGMRFGEAASKDKAAMKMLMEIGESYEGLEEVLEEFAAETGFGSSFGKMDSDMGGSSKGDIEQVVFDLEDIHTIVSGNSGNCANMGKELGRLADRNGNLMKKLETFEGTKLDEEQKAAYGKRLEKVFTASSAARTDCGQDETVTSALSTLGF